MRMNIWWRCKNTYDTASELAEAKLMLNISLTSLKFVSLDQAYVATSNLYITDQDTTISFA